MDDGENGMKAFSILSSKLGAVFLVAFTGVALTPGCAESSDDDDTAGRAGESGSGGKGGSGGSGGSSGKGGAGSAGKGGSGGKGSAGEAGETGTGGTPGEAGSAGETGSAGQETAGAGGSAGDSGSAGAAGQGGEGSEPLIAGATCRAILEDLPSATTGLYLVDPDGDGGEDAVITVCDMQTEGGGWTLGLIKNSLDSGLYATFAAGRVNVTALAVLPETAAAATAGTPYAGWIDLNEFPYTDLELAGYRNGLEVYRSQAIPKSELRIPFGQNGYYLYDQVDGYYWCGGANDYTVNGVGQVDQPSGAPSDCKGHSSLGDGWDFGTATYNEGLTACGGGSALMTTGDSSGYVYYGAPGAAQAFWVR